MATPKANPPPAVLFAAVFSQQESALEWASERLEQMWGSVVLRSPVFDHGETRYYQDEMGTGLRKQFLVVEGLYDPANLASTKLQSNEWESELAGSTNYSVSRPVNIDPGYLTLSKLVLASAKDRAHRIYLSSGIYAEECLYFLNGQWQSRPWTYPDYCRQDFHDFFVTVRDYLKQLLANTTHS